MGLYVSDEHFQKSLKKNYDKCFFFNNLFCLKQFLQLLKLSERDYKRNFNVFNSDNS